MKVFEISKINLPEGAGCYADNAFVAIDNDNNICGWESTAFVFTGIDGITADNISTWQKNCNGMDFEKINGGEIIAEVEI